MRVLESKPQRLARYATDALLTPTEVAQWLQVSRRTLQRLPIPARTMGHRIVRYLVRDVLTYLDRCARGNSTSAA